MRRPPGRPAPGESRGNKFGARQKPPANGPACSGLGAGFSSKPPELEVADCHCQWKAAGPPRHGPLHGGRLGPRLARPQGSARASLGPPGVTGQLPLRPAEASESPASGGPGSRSVRRGGSGHWGQACGPLASLRPLLSGTVADSTTGIWPADASERPVGPCTCACALGAAALPLPHQLAHWRPHARQSRQQQRPLFS